MTPQLIAREIDPTLGARLLATDQYFYEVRCIWLPIPLHWVGCWSRRVDHRVRDNLGRELL